MKKIVFILLLLPFCMGKVFAADVYYSEYTPFSDWQEEVVYKNDMMNVEEEVRYRWYKINQVPGNYELFQSDGLFLNDCYQTPFTDWSTIQPSYHESRLVQERTKYTYKLDTGMRYIHLTNVSGSYDSFRIPELRTMIDGQDINYTYTCNGCNDTFDNHIHNGNVNENWSSLTNGGSLLIDLGRVYPAHKVELQFYIYDVGTDPKTYTVSFSKDGINMLGSQTYTLNFTGWEYSESAYRVHNIYNMGIGENIWTTTTSTYTPYNNEFQLSTTTQQEYAYTEKMCRTYTENKQYTTSYLKDGNSEFPNKDNNQSKIYYRYQTRDKLELADIHVIDKQTDNWDIFVLSASKPYQVTENIDWSKNGTYLVTFQVGDLEVNKEIEVELIENKIADYERQIDELTNQLQQLQMDKEKQKEKYEKQISNLEKESDDLRQQLQSCEEMCRNEKECLQEVIHQKEKLIQEYEAKILELSNALNEYQVRLEEQEGMLRELEETIRNLQTQLNQLQKNNETLKKTIAKNQEKLEKSEQKIIELTADNKNYKQLLKDKQKELIKIEKENIQYIKDIESLKKELETVIREKEESISLSEEAYNQKLDSQNNLISAYKDKIQQLTNQLRNVNNQIGQVISDNNNYQSENLELQASINELQRQYKELQDKIELYEEKVQKQEKMSQELEVSKREKDDLNQEYNNYILKIRNEKKLSSLWFYIICSLLFMSVIIYKWRKKSNVK